LKGVEEDEHNGAVLYVGSHEELRDLLRSDALADELILLKGSEKIDKLLLALPDVGEEGIPAYRETLPAWDQVIRGADYFAGNE